MLGFECGWFVSFHREEEATEGVWCFMVVVEAITGAIVTVGGGEW
jgi:hypothetical protein